MRALRYKWLWAVVLTISFTIACEFEEATFVKPKPVGSTAVNVTSTSFTARWHTMLDVDKYIIDVAYDKSFNNLVPNYQGIASADTFITVSSIGANMQYYYRVRSQRGFELSEPSTPVAVRTSNFPKPSINEASDLTSTSFKVSWNEVDGADHYLLSIGLDADFSAILEGYSAKIIEELEHTVTDLVPKKTYFFRIKAASKNGLSEYSEIKQINTGNLATPVIASPTEITQTTFTANWNFLSGAKNYLLDVSTKEDFSDVVKGFEAKEVDADYYTVTELDANKIYYYRIKAKNDDYLSDYTESRSATTLNISSPAGLPASNVSLSGFTANWQTDDKFTTSFKFDVSDDPSFTTKLPQFQDIEVKGNSYTIADLIPGKPYYYRVYGQGLNSTSEASNIVEVKTDGLNSPTVLPVENLAQFSFDINWVYDQRVDYYTLDVSLTPDFSTYINGFQNRVVTSAPITVDNLSPATQYYFRLKSKEGDSESSYSSFVNIKTLDLAVPTLLPITDVSEFGFTINYEKDDRLDYYLIDVATDSEFTNFVTGYKNRSVTTNTVVITNLTPGQNYYYRIKSKIGNKESQYTITEGVSTVVLPTPQNIVVSSRNEFGFSLTWDSDPKFDYFVIDIATDTEFKNLLKGYEGLNTTNKVLEVNNLSPGTAYYFRIRAKTGLATSAYTNIIKVETTAIAQPQQPSASQLTEFEFLLTWSIDDRMDYYMVYIATDSEFNNPIAGYNGKVINTSPEKVTGLSPGTTFYIKIKAVANGKSSTASETLVVTTQGIGSPLPNISGVSRFSFIVSWDYDSRMDFYILDIATDATFTNFISGYQNRSVTSTPVQVENLTADATYYIRLRSVTGTEYSAHSATIEVKTSALEKPILSSSQIEEFGFQLNWNLDSKMNYYELDLSTSSDFSSFVSGYAARTVTLGQITVESLAANTTYYARIRCKAGTTYSDYSDVISVTTSAIPAPTVSLLSSDKYSSQLSWNYDSNMDYYILDVASDAGFSNYVEGYHNRNVTSSPENVTGLVPNTQYYARIKARKGSKESVYSTVINFTTSSLDIPVLSVNQANEFDAQLSWNYNNNVDYYILDIATDNTFSNFVSGYQNRNVTQSPQQISGLTPNTTYYARIKSKFGTKESDYSTVISFMTSVLPAPSITVSNIGNYDATLSWTYDSNVDYYSLDVATDNGFTSKVSGYSDRNLTASPFKIDNLIAGRTYYVRLKSVSGSEHSVYSTTRTFTTTSLTAPSLTIDQVTEFSVRCSWSYIGAMDNYVLQVSTSSSFSTFVTGYENKAITSSPFTISNLSPNTTYYARMKAVSGSSESVFSSIKSFTTVNIQQPSISVSDVQEFSFDINWTYDNNVDLYEVEVATDNSFTNKVSGYAPRSVTSSPFEVNGLAPNTLYYVRIRAKSGSSYSSYSNVASLTTVSLLPPQLQTVTDNKAFSASINWTNPSVFTNIMLTIAYDNSFTEIVSGYNRKEVTGTSFVFEKEYFDKLVYFKLETKYLSYYSAPTSTVQVESAIASGCKLTVLAGQFNTETIAYNASNEIETITSTGNSNYTINVTYSGGKPSVFSKVEGAVEKERYELFYDGNGLLDYAKYYKKAGVFPIAFENAIDIKRSSKVMIGMDTYTDEAMTNLDKDYDFVLDSKNNVSEVKLNGVTHITYKYDDNLNPYALFDEAFFLVLDNRTTSDAVARFFPVIRNITSETYGSNEYIYSYDYDSKDMATRRGGNDYMNMTFSGCTSK